MHAAPVSHELDHVPPWRGSISSASFTSSCSTSLAHTHVLDSQPLPPALASHSSSTAIQPASLPLAYVTVLALLLLLGGSSVGPKACNHRVNLSQARACRLASWLFGCQEHGTEADDGWGGSRGAAGSWSGSAQCHRTLPPLIPASLCWPHIVSASKCGEIRAAAADVSGQARRPVATG